MKKYLLIGVLASFALSGCVSMGIGTQQQSETAYAITAAGENVGIKLGKIAGEAATLVCQGDIAAYTTLISTRSVTDGVKSYAPADLAHAALQTTCSVPVSGG